MHLSQNAKDKKKITSEYIFLSLKIEIEHQQ